jgi:hypothetical protein
MDPFEALDYIANALKKTIEYANPNDDYYETHWKPRIECIRASIRTPELNLYEVIDDITKHTQCVPPDDKLMSK